MGVKIEYKYHHLLFTEESRDRGNITNMAFWQKLDDLQNKNANHQIYVDITVRFDRMIGRYCEILLIRCEKECIEKDALLLYNSLYHLVPIDVCPEVGKISDQDVYL